MRENNRNPIERCRKRLPQFTTMNVIDGQAGLVIYSSLIFYSLTIDNILNIIVLLILAGVTIATLTGENGIITKAQEAREETEKSGVIEQVKTDIMAIQTESISSDAKASDLKEVLDRYFIDVPEPNYITADTILTTKDEYGKGYKISVSQIYNGEIKIVSIPEGLEIGSTVSYNPNGTYIWKYEYCGSPKNTSYEQTLNSGTGQYFNIDVWKVLDINEGTGEITLVPEHSTYAYAGYNGSVYLYGAQGYNNGVKLLNDACSNLYGNSSKGITARSISIEDIEEKMTDTALEEAHKFTGIQASYGQQISSGYTTDNSYYPIIYAKEALRSLSGEDRITSGLGMSEQTSLINANDDGATDGYLQGTSLRPTQTYWYGNKSFLQTAFKVADNDVNYYNLLVPDGTNTYYWLASRCVIGNNHEGAFFAMNAIFYGEVRTNTFMFDSNRDCNLNQIGLFPIVSLSAENIRGDSSTGFEVK